ncbi:YaeQ family protein [Thiothrix lacustris]|uniref:YaeQ family protein n=1 Tax=Thiothrix lacustris TaxID=525917 RepID=A0ABY9MKI5_9GAMM|nr:YaeQ family protein [Thiothrix lacustris]WML89126.1 YaeQ family protein [Thiothrix lacustris]WMP15790.1 YaeQ family protein [Thiothrix lacustris]
MAIKPTIYKARISLSDMERDYYDALNLTIAQHPSETLERMMVRVLAYCLNAQEGIELTKGLEDAEEPAVWVRTMDDQIALWIDLGEPTPERVKKATHRARKVRVYSFNNKSDVWWSQNVKKLSQLDASFYRLAWEEVEALAALVNRTMDLSITITGNSAYVAGDKGEVEIHWDVLQSN